MSHRSKPSAERHFESDPDLASLTATLAHATSLTARISLIRSSVDARVVFTSSFGIEDQALLHALADSNADIEVVTFDTGRLFPETLDTIDASARRYAVNIRIISPEASESEAIVARDGVLGLRTSIEARKACCEVRKVRPLTRVLTGASGWMTGLRRQQSAERADTPLVTFDASHKLLKFNPIADWSNAELLDYIETHDVPINPLHAQGYHSIGCSALHTRCRTRR